MPAISKTKTGARVGLALAGGGPEGAIYEIGAVRALEEAIDGLDLVDLDTYVGVSAGAFVASCLANGLSPQQLCRAIISPEPGEHPFMPEMFFTPAIGEFASRSLMVPMLLWEALRDYVSSPNDLTLVESLTRLARALPTGLFNNEPIRVFLQKIFALKGRTDDFRELRRRLIVVTSDLDSGRSVCFGEPGLDHVPISTAVQASTALPGLYPPVLIDGRHYCDGVLLKTVHASVALDHGVDLLFALNPIVPVDTHVAVERGVMRRGKLVHRGLPTVISQTLRTIVHSRMIVGMSVYKPRYPHADVVLLEPAPDDYRMFFTNIFSFSSRKDTCEHAYRTTLATLAARRLELEPLLEKYGLRLRREVIEDSERSLWAQVGIPERGRRAPITASLDRTLASLELLVGDLEARTARLAAIESTASLDEGGGSSPENVTPPLLEPPGDGDRSSSSPAAS